MTGSFVAWKLASLGWRVKLYDPFPTPRPVCAGLVSMKCVREHHLEPFILRRIDGARIHAGAEELTIERKGVAAVIDREALDKELRELALSEGAEFEQRWVTRRDLEGMDALIVVGADGPTSTVRRFLGLQEPQLLRAAQGVISGHFDHYVDVFLDVVPDFFGWIVPLDDKRALLGVATAGNPISPLKHLSKRLKRRVRDIRGGQIPVEPLKRVKVGNYYLVGDAAGQVKPTTGGGIYYGLLAAKALFQSIHQRLTGGTDFYQSFHLRRIYPKLALLRMLFRLYPRIQWEGLLREARESGIVEALERRGDMEDPAFLFTPPFLPFIFRIAFPWMNILRRPSESPNRSSRAKTSGRK